MHGLSGWGSHVVGTQLMKNSKGVDICIGRISKTKHKPFITFEKAKALTKITNQYRDITCLSQY